MNYTNECSMCGKEFKAKSPWRAYCDQCRKIKHKAVMEAYHSSRPKPPKYTRHKTDEQIAQSVQEVKSAELQRRKKYCAAYDESRLDCVKCYANQVANYKACKK